MERKPKKSRKGISCHVDPIRSTAEINRIKVLLKDKPRDLALFTLGINNGLRGGDLLKLTYGQLKHCKPGDEIEIVEGKTKKRNSLMVNKSSYKALKSYFETKEFKDEDRIFPITLVYLNLLMKKWCREAGVNHGNYGSHTLRKSFGFIQRTVYAVGIEVLMNRFNHANQAITLRYIGVSRDEVHRALLNEI